MPGGTHSPENSSTASASTEYSSGAKFCETVRSSCAYCAGVTCSAIPVGAADVAAAAAGESHDDDAADEDDDAPAGAADAAPSPPPPTPPTTSVERVMRTVYNFGNMSAASNVLALDFALRYGNLDRKIDDEGRVLEVFNRPEERIQAGELVLMPSIGGGYLMGCIGFIAEEPLIKAMEADRELAAAEGAHGLL